MKRRTTIHHNDETRRKPELSEEDKRRADFYQRWYAKFGKPQTRTLPGDEFMKRLKEMVDFE